MRSPYLGNKPQLRNLLLEHILAGTRPGGNATEKTMLLTDGRQRSWSSCEKPTRLPKLFAALLSVHGAIHIPALNAAKTAARRVAGTAGSERCVRLDDSRSGQRTRARLVFTISRHAVIGLCSGGKGRRDRRRRHGLRSGTSRRLHAAQRLTSTNLKARNRPTCPVSMRRGTSC
jgi:hypothetical protein